MQSSKDQPPVRPGEILGGKYRVEKIIGVGGMGVVVAARHIDLDTYVALKFLLPDALDEESVQRFSREARAMVRLQSPHVARVFDVGKLDSGAPYMVMELLVGQDLGELLEQSGPLSIADAVEYVLQACEGIAEAHAMGIIHRDLKPRNIFLTRHADGRVLVKVLDFGLAKSVTTMGPAERALTQTSAIMGSPMYMSPEQMRASREVDVRTDVWSLGVCLYELLTRAAPFDAPTIPELCALVLAGTPRPPEAVRPDIPPGLSAAIMRCLEKDAQRRFASIGELARALAPFARWSAEARPPSIAEVEPHRRQLPSNKGDTRADVSFDPRVERSRGWTVSAVVGVVLVLLIGGIGAVVLRRAVRAKALATSAASHSAPVEPLETIPLPPPVVSAAPSVAAEPVAPRPAPSMAPSASPASAAGVRPRPRLAAPVKSAPPKAEVAPAAAPPITTAF